MLRGVAKRHERLCEHSALSPLGERAVFRISLLFHRNARSQAINFSRYVFSLRMSSSWRGPEISLSMVRGPS